jgi:uncharacterized DUF497 family protein
MRSSSIRRASEKTSVSPLPIQPIAQVLYLRLVALTIIIFSMYNIIMDTLRFEWDPNKNEINKKKHGLSFEAAKEVFYDEFAILFDDPDHSIEEDRFLIIGSIKSQKICIVSHCYRDNENCVRIISARQATKTEQRIYLDGI